MPKIKTILLVFVLVILSSTVYAKTPIRICAGSPTGMFTYVAVEISKRIENKYKVTIVPSFGAVDNIRKLMRNECDVGLSLTDVMHKFNFENPASLKIINSSKILFTEYTHLICPVASGWTNISDIGKNKGKVIIGPDGSGSEEAWKNLTSVDPELYKDVTKIHNVVGLASIAMVRDSKNTCMLWLSGLNSPDIKVTNIMSVANKDEIPSLRLLNIDDYRMQKLKDVRGKLLYKFMPIIRIPVTTSSIGAYTNLINDSYWPSVLVPTIDALFIYRNDYMKNNAHKEYLQDALDNLSNTIWKQTIFTE